MAGEVGGGRGLAAVVHIKRPTARKEERCII